MEQKVFDRGRYVAIHDTGTEEGGFVVRVMRQPVNVLPRAKHGRVNIEPRPDRGDMPEHFVLVADPGHPAIGYTCYRSFADAIEGAKKVLGEQHAEEGESAEEQVEAWFARTT